MLQLIVEGHTGHEVARRFAISTKNIDSRRSHITKRLNIHDLAGLVKYAVRSGLVQP